MTLKALRRLIEELFVKMKDFEESGVRGSADAVDKAALGLQELGISFSEAKGVEFREDPVLKDKTRVRKEFMESFAKVYDDFMATYNAALKKTGRRRAA